MNALSAPDGYRLWAPTYEAETAITFIEDGLVAYLTPPLSGRRLLDAGCGTGRRLKDSGAAFALGVDISPEMLAIGKPEHGVVGDIRALPVAPGTFHVVWCRLAIGHVEEAATVYAELARACAPGGAVVVTDFHADAIAAGHRRSFRDGNGDRQEVVHWVHEADEQIGLAAAAGLTLIDRRDGAIGPEVRPFYERAGRAVAHDEHLGLNVVLALSFRREG
ncbi:MAG: Methyltransferase type 11 [Sphingomonas bacterium]|uniref:class I SAM-dependent methyltransferase n=1 Tax=Sphingomonas bacterium TaxID=1895847 RepID=UPI002620B665|nr:class I SAM-dependent methyltransferase [Sphingomonas bacterium]MDB5703920.1 Methyltransferase type 11 [Sphingomonas bacterium]